MDDQKTALLDEFLNKVLGSESRPPGATEFAGIIEAKLDFGTRKYGPGSWMRHDMIGELLTELIDTFNYPYLAWRVLRELGLDQSNPQLFLRAEQAFRRIALESFNNWATLSRLLATLDANGVPRSVSGENRVGVQMEINTDDGTDDATATEGRAAAADDAGGSSDSGGDGEVRPDPAGPATSGESRDPATGVRG